MLSTVVTMFYPRSSDFIPLIAESLYPFTDFSLFSPPLAPGNPFSTLCFYSLIFYLNSTCTCYYEVFIFVYISLSIMSSSSCHIIINGRISFFLMVELHPIVYIHIHAYTHTDTKSQIVSRSWLF